MGHVWLLASADHVAGFISPHHADESETTADMPPDHDHPFDPMPLIGEAVFVAFGIFICLVVFGMVRKRSPSTVAGQMLSPLVAESIARTLARRYLVKLAIAMVLAIGLASVDLAFMAVLVCPFAIVWLFELLSTRFVLRQFDKKIERLEKRDNWIFINSSKLYAPRRVWKKASPLPTAGLA